MKYSAFLVLFHQNMESNIQIGEVQMVEVLNMGKIKLKIAILFVLLLCLGASYLYMNGMKIEDVPTAIGESLTNNDKDYTIYEYTITKIDGDEYYGQAKNGTKIIFNGKKFEDDVSDLKKGDRIKAYFSKEKRIDGLIKVVKVVN